MSGSYIGKTSDGVLPNITGSIGSAESHNGVSGAFYNGSNRSGLFHRANQGTAADINFSASRSSSIYGSGWFDGTRVVPASVGMNYCIKY